VPVRILSHGDFFFFFFASFCRSLTPYILFHFILAVNLTQTEKRATREHKSSYIQQVREAVDKHDSLYLFSYENMRSSKFKNVRLEFRGSDEVPSRIFLGKNKLLQIALGRNPEEEYSDNLRHVAKGITGGSVGLLFTSRPRNEVEGYFESMIEPDFARAGSVSSRTVMVTNELLERFPVSMMEQFRKLGMPVEIKVGRVVLRDEVEEFRVCKEGETLSAEKCKLLVHFEIKVANFKVDLVSRWADGEYEELMQ
jgi:mRNA turnover protein 4